MEETVGFMDKLAEDVAAFDVESSLPELNNVIGWFETLARIAVLVGPLLILVLGLIYYFAPPKEANHKHGYRFYWGMGSVEAWQFTQRVAGAIWSVLGLVLSVIMLVVALGLDGNQGVDMASTALTCALWELATIGIACIAIDVLVAMRYDRKGEVRPNTKIPENLFRLPNKK